MGIIEFLEIALKWAWGTLITAIVTAVLTMFLKHGKRWFRGARKFIRTGRVEPRVRRNRMMPQMQAGQAAVRPPRFSLTSILQALGQINQPSRRSSTTTNDAGASQNDVPLDLKF